jgi:hypothetical protein
MEYTSPWTKLELITIMTIVVMGTDYIKEDLIL